MKPNSLAVLLWLSFFGLLSIEGRAQAIGGPTNGLVCYYRLNGTANDALGKGNAGVLYNGAYYTNGIGGQPKAAVWCNGTGGYVYMGKNDILYPNLALTWSLWVRPEEEAVGPVFWDDDGQNGGDRGISIVPTLLFGGSLFVNAPLAEAPITAVGQLTPRVWHHLAFTADASGQSLYVDGAQVAGRSRPLLDHTGRSSVSFGAGNSSFTGPNSVYLPGFKGAICLARIYQRALSAFEVAGVYNAESEWPAGGGGAIVATHRALSLSFSNLVAGVAYQVQVAQAAQGPYSNFARPFLATNSVMPVTGSVIVSASEKLFFRVGAP